ncbi:NADH-quinone oxidoreductase subunit J family protein [Halocatena pleomorpha]|uniref:Proton-conducting membrane transporter n=1 Tax=Halocatena pleomorpha TaxID=1785090 RepID=A0A3P3RJ31_9EURY|nr:proton-conducting membrane transporter [Halocatena pleomorpha]RRJ33432.1 proton-conducting membrane transporter [Halocatena pleomorpha]
MTTRPRLQLGRHLLSGLAAVALFAVMAAAFLPAQFPPVRGFESGSITASIGYALFDLSGPIASEYFLVAFEITGVLLVAALTGAVMLARRENDSNATGVASRDVRTDGGPQPGEDRR